MTTCEFSELPRAAHNMAIYANNDYTIYSLVNWLTQALAKKVARGLVPDLNYLAYCSTMKKIAGMAAKVVKTNDEITPTKEDRRAFCVYMAESIINEIQE